MKEVFKVIGATFGILILIYVLVFFATGGDLAIYRFWAPQQADAQREVFTHSQSYVQGKIQNIGELCSAASKAEGNQKLAVYSEIRNEAATVKLAMLPSDEQACVQTARGGE